jgi:hypothetical protein
MTNQTTPRKRPVWQLVLAVIIAMIAISLFVPQVRASLSTWLGLSVAPSDRVPAPPVTLIPITATPPVNPTLESVGKSASPQAQSVTGQGTTLSGIPDLKQLANQAGWDIFTPGWLPEGYKFQSAHYDPNQKVVFLTYLVSRALPDSSGSSLTATKTISFLQALKDDFIPMQVAPATNVEDIEFNDMPAAYAVGAWDTQFVPDDQEPSGGKFISAWRNDLQVQNVYWQDGDVYLVLVTDDETLTKQNLLDMASSISR